MRSLVLDLGGCLAEARTAKAFALLRSVFLVMRSHFGV